MSAWKVYKPSATAPWNLQRVVHLHRRAAFGATWTEIQRDLRDGPDASIERVLNGEPTRGSQTSPQSVAAPAAEASSSLKPQASSPASDFESVAAVIGNAAVDSGSADRLKAWWLYRCLFSPHPLAERLAFVWHNHFATSNLKVNDLRLMKLQNETFRQRAFAPFGELLSAVVHDPALLEWLDATSNRKQHPNENLARELMELFTLGIGHYSEEDIKQAARALTGWTVRQGEFRTLPAVHDDEPKTILGRTGNFSGDDLVTMLAEHPATSRRIAWRLAGEFFGEGVVDDAALSELADGLRRHNLDVRFGVETILRSELFFNERNIGTRVCDPVSFIVGPLRALECGRDPPSTLVLAEWVARMGQDLFYPPNVGGWAGGRAWLSTRNVVSRANSMAALVDGSLHTPARPPDLAALAAMHTKERDVPGAARFFSRLLHGTDNDAEIDKAVKENGGARELSPLVLKLLTGTQAYLH